MGTTDALVVSLTARKISIHVPAMGTTAFQKCEASALAISIHVPAMGTTRHQTPGRRLAFHFNPRARDGHDNSAHGSAGKMVISIHVPAMGTTGRNWTHSRPTSFQSTCPRWARHDRDPRTVREILISSHVPRPDGHPTRQKHRAPLLGEILVMDELVHVVPVKRQRVFFPLLLNVHKRPPPAAKTEVLEPRQHQEVRIVIHRREPRG